MHLSKIPSGLRYYIGNAARKRRAVEDSAIAVFDGWSYEEIITPTVDYYSLFEQGMGAEAHNAFRFTDFDGRLLALRPDVTSSVARASATLLAEKPRPLRLCYAAPVFHQRQQTRAEWRRESTQLGCELIGSGSLAADIEPLAILAETLTQLRLNGNYRITLNHVELFNGIAEHLELNKDSRERLRALIDVRDTSGLMDLLGRLGANEDERKLFARVTRLSGKRAIIEEARKVIRSTRASAALDALEKIWDVLEQLGLADSFEIDLGDVSGLEYYTGLLFKVYVRGSGIRVGRGGRYDQLTSIFGRAEPAIGFVLDLDALTEVIAESGTNIGRRESARSVEISSADTISAFREAMERRARNERVSMVA
ncbi:MAG TPA: ATP phosphoribosyltransferase regulatory subunit [Pyrinomonadaceae bacterium]|nr:ATP phosphoribosyltransferase regulatory subunit [Pyrinomonadaceae bacterium]